MSADEPGRRRWLRVGAGALAVSCVLAARVATRPERPESPDALLFQRAMERYAVAETRPHWPGYPVYVWSGWLLAWAGADSGQALRYVSVLASTLSLAPLVALAGGWARATGKPPAAARRAAVHSGVVWATLPVAWVTGSHILSDPLALCLALCVLLLCDRLLAAPAERTGLLVALTFLAGVLLGVRLAYAVLLAPVMGTVLVAVSGRRMRPTSLALGGGAFSLGVLVWLAWQWWREGEAFLRAASHTLRGHFETWGGSMTTHPDVGSRLRTLFEHWLVDALGLWMPGLPLVRLPLTVFWIVLLVAGTRRLLVSGGPAAGRTRLLVALWSVPYLLLAFTVLDLDQARYALPLAAMASVLAGLGLPTRSAAALPIMGAWLLLATMVSLPMARWQRRHPRVEYEIARFLRDRPGAILLHLHGDLVPALVADGAAGSVLTRAVGPEELSERARAFEEAGRRVYATFTPPGAPGSWRPITRFCVREPLDPVSAAELWLFEHAPGAAPTAHLPPLPECQ